MDMRGGRIKVRPLRCRSQLRPLPVFITDAPPSETCRLCKNWRLSVQTLNRFRHRSVRLLAQQPSFRRLSRSLFVACLMKGLS